MKRDQERKSSAVAAIFFVLFAVVLSGNAEAATVSMEHSQQRPKGVEQLRFLEPFQAGGMIPTVIPSENSYSSAYGSALRLGLDELRQKRATDLTGQIEGRLDQLLLPGVANGTGEFFLAPSAAKPNFKLKGSYRAQTGQGDRFTSTSIGVSYPLTNRFTLDGNYAVVKRDQRVHGQAGHEERLIPSVGASYAVNTSTSISVNYRRANLRDPRVKKGQEEHQARAELKINF